MTRKRRRNRQVVARAQLRSLSPAEQMSVYRIARNFQDNRREVLRRLEAEVGKDRILVAIEWLRTVVK